MIRGKSGGSLKCVSVMGTRQGNEYMNRYFSVIGLWLAVTAEPVVFISCTA